MSKNTEARFTELVSAVTAETPIDATPKKRKQSRGSKTNRKRVIAATLTMDQVDPRVREAAEKTRRPGQLFRPVSATEVMVVNQ